MSVYSYAFSSSPLWIGSRRVFRTPQCRYRGRSVSTGFDKPPEIKKQNSEGKYYTLDPVEMEPVFQVDRVSHSLAKEDFSSMGEIAGKIDLSNSGEILSYNKVKSGGKRQIDQEKESRVDDDDDEEPLAKNLNNTVGLTPYRVSWYDYGTVSPSKRFAYWAYRRLRELPPDWQEYYRRMLYQEVSAARYVNQTWDCFMMVVDGYRKAKWILKKYNIPIDETLIPKPYNNFWEETTHEERVWAHRRSHQLKELQALQRDEDDLVFGAHMMDRRELSYGSIKNLQTGMQGGTPVHAHDLPAPCEANVQTSPHTEDMSSALMSSIEDDKLWNPVLRSRLHTKRMREEVELYSFEDDDDDIVH